MPETPTVLVAGATGSIGGATAVGLTRRGAGVVLLGRRQERLDARADWVRDTLSEAPGGTAVDIRTLAFDLSDMDAVRRAAAEALERFPSIDALVLSVGALLENGPNILPSGHEAMFATNVMGPFLLTELLRERMERTHGVVVHVIAPFRQEIDWDDIETIGDYKTMKAFDRTKVFNRMIAGELARRSGGRIASIAFNPSFVLDKQDPDLKERWPSGRRGLIWRVMGTLFARQPSVAGEPLAELVLSGERRPALNGALFKLDRRADKPDAAMSDEVSGARLWDLLEGLTGLSPEAGRPG